LNSILLSITSHYSPPSTKGKEIKLKYIVQVSSSPPLFAIFSNHPNLIGESYRRYVENQIRKAIDLEGVPIRISFRKSKS
jgi:GTP-binding protein